MSGAIDDGGPAFPQTSLVSDEREEGYAGPMWEHGMTLRDYFAAKALSECIRVAADQTPPGGDLRLSKLLSKAAVYAFSAADAMLKARQS